MELLKSCQEEVAGLRMGAAPERLEALRRDLKDLEGDLEQLHATWLQFMEGISDLQYLQSVREMGNADIQHLSAALGKLRTQLRSLGVRATPAVSQPTGGPQSTAGVRVVASGPAAPAEAVNVSLHPPATSGHPAASSVHQSSHRQPPVEKPKNAAHPKVKIDALKIPNFDGELLSYSEFKRNFKALVEEPGYPEEACVLYLKDALPKSLDYLMVGVRQMEVAWSRLDDRLRVRALYEQLMKLELKGREYEGLERMYFEVENTCQMAEQMGAA